MSYIQTVESFEEIPLHEISRSNYFNINNITLRQIWNHLKRKYNHPILCILLPLLCAIILLPVLCFQRDTVNISTEKPTTSESSYSKEEMDPRYNCFV